jgi:hypothetical protein
MRPLNGYMYTNHSHLWLFWKVLPNQIHIEWETRLKYMITKYNKATHEVLFPEIDLGNCVPMIVMEKDDVEE